jgi:flagellar motor switch protein FliN/FliY
MPASQSSQVAVTPVAPEEETPSPVVQEATTARPRDRSSLDSLPSYARSLLKVEVPVTVKLAAKKQTVEEILRLGAGSIIQFDKSCDETLEMAAGNHPIAEGEAVKIGDKFGLRITSIILPDERFQVVHGK